MQAQPKAVDRDNVTSPSVLKDAPSQKSSPATLAGKDASGISPVVSPARALQQVLVERMADALDANDVRAIGSISALPAKLPISISLAIIFGTSVGMWLMITAAAWIVL